MTTITGNARFREAVAAKLVRAIRPDGTVSDSVVPTQSGTPPGDYSIDVDTRPLILQAHAFDPEKLIGPWRPEFTYSVGDIVFETAPAPEQLVLECIASTGQSGGTEPSWDSAVGETTVDSDVTWVTLGTIAELTPITQLFFQPVLIASISPATGSTTGGAAITITGAGFEEGATATIGGAAVTNLVVVSDTTITCETPTGTEGDSDVVVTVGSESATLTDGFTYTIQVLLGNDHELQTTSSDTWTHSYLLPDDTELALFTMHHRGGEINTVTYGGVTATLIDKSDADFPETYIYAIADADLPAKGVSHDLVVAWHNFSTSDRTGATSITAIQGVHTDVLADLSTIVSNSQYLAAAASISTDVTLSAANYFVFDAVSAREGGASYEPDGLQTELFYGQWAAPRAAGSSYKFAEAPSGSVSMSWSGGSGSAPTRHVVAGVKLA